MYLFFSLSAVGMAVGVGVGVGVVGVEVEGKASINCSNNCWQSLIWDFKFEISSVDISEGKKIKDEDDRNKRIK